MSYSTMILCFDGLALTLFVFKHDKHYYMTLYRVHLTIGKISIWRNQTYNFNGDRHWLQYIQLLYTMVIILWTSNIFLGVCCISWISVSLGKSTTHKSWYVNKTHGTETVAGYPPPQQIMSWKTNLQVVTRKVTILAIKNQNISTLSDVLITICTDNESSVQWFLRKYENRPANSKICTVEYNFAKSYFRKTKCSVEKGYCLTA